jgi:hypothetical protein
MKKTDARIAAAVSDLKAEGYEVLVAEMPNADGEVRVFVDAASKRYSQKVTVILPDRYQKKGNRWLGVYKGKLVTDKKKVAQILERAKTDKKLKLRVIRKPNGVFLKAGKPVTMTKRDVMAYVMKGRRKAGYEPVHRRPGVGQKISKAVKRSWKEGVGKYGKLKKD